MTDISIPDDVTNVEILSNINDQISINVDDINSQLAALNTKISNIDPIHQAIATSNARINNVNLSEIETRSIVSESKINLPKTKNSILLLKQKSAEVQKVISINKNKSLTKDYINLDVIKKALTSLGVPTVTFPKLPLTDKKVLQSVGVLQKIKKLASDRKYVSVENIKKSREAFTWPMVPVAARRSGINIPDLPFKPSL